MDLSPFKSIVRGKEGHAELKNIEGFVVLNKKGALVAESADGVVRSTRLKNDPQGVANFGFKPSKDGWKKEWSG